MAAVPNIIVIECDDDPLIWVRSRGAVQVAIYKSKEASRQANSEALAVVTVAAVTQRQSCGLLCGELCTG